MGKLEHADADELRRALDTAESPKGVKRLVVALSYLDGVSVDTMARRYGIPRSTLYYWLDRFETHSVREAIEDESRPGRPPKLDSAQRDKLRQDLAADPSEHGYGVSEWTPALVRRHITEEYGISYSEGHVRRLIRRFSRPN